MKNIPKVRLGLVAVSRDCFPLELSKKRRVAAARECRARKLPLAEMQTVKGRSIIKNVKRLAPNMEK